MAKNKGGARHFAKPAIDPGVLLKILRNQTDNIKDLGPYETISKTGAVNPKGLLECRSFLQDIIEVVPTCEIAPQVLRTSLMNLLSHNVSLNATRFNGLTWANIKAERTTVLMAHCRKVAREKDQQRLCMAKLTSHEYLQLQALISDVAIKDEDSLEKGKNLKRRTSDASLGSDGFPKLLQSPEMEKKVPTCEALFCSAVLSSLLWPSLGRGRRDGLLLPHLCPDRPCLGGIIIQTTTCLSPAMRFSQSLQVSFAWS